jgi:hypothetical protein
VRPAKRLKNKIGNVLKGQGLNKGKIMRKLLTLKTHRLIQNKAKKTKNNTQKMIGPSLHIQKTRNKTFKTKMRKGQRVKIAGKIGGKIESNKKM